MMIVLVKEIWIILMLMITSTYNNRRRATTSRLSRAASQ